MTTKRITKLKAPEFLFLCSNTESNETKYVYQNKIARNEEKIETNRMCSWTIAFICFDFLPVIVQDIHLFLGFCDSLLESNEFSSQISKTDSSFITFVLVIKRNHAIDRSIEQLFRSRLISIHYRWWWDLLTKFQFIYSHDDCAIIIVNCDECQMPV